ncbi:MAG: hypothetical protein AB7F86_11870 [Bdellovibrionales bacterium]
MKKLVLPLATSVLTVLFFQNCQKAKLTSVGGEDFGSLTTVQETNDNQPPNPGPAPSPDPNPAPSPSPDPGPSPSPNPNPNPNPNPTPTPTPAPNPNPDSCPSDNGDDDNSSDDKSHDSSSDNDSSSDDSSHDKQQKQNHNGGDNSSDDNSGDDCRDHNGREEGAREYVCTVMGPGSSTRLACGDDEISPLHEGPKFLCMTKKACEEIGGLAFPDARAEKRGWCKTDSNNHHVKHISDERMQELVDKYLQEHPNGPGPTGNNTNNPK